VTLAGNASWPLIAPLASALATAARLALRIDAPIFQEFARCWVNVS